MKFDHIVKKKKRQSDGKYYYLIKWSNMHSRTQTWEPAEHIPETCIVNFETSLHKSKQLLANQSESGEPDAWFHEQPHTADVRSVSDIGFAPQSLSLLDNCNDEEFLQMVMDDSIEDKLDSCKKDRNVNKFYNQTAGMYAICFYI